MADGPSLPIALTFAGLAGETRPATEPGVLAPEVGVALRAFFDAHPAVAAAHFELALSEAGDDLEFAGGMLLDAAGSPLGAGRDGERAGAEFRRLLRHDPQLAALPIALTIAFGGIDQAFRIDREATGAAPATPAVRDPAAAARDDARAAARERAQLRTRDERYDQRDELPDRFDGIDEPA